MSNIEWTERTWNPVVGCNAISPGCKHCYAETMAKRLKAMALADIAAGKDPGRKAHYIDAINDRGKWSGQMVEVPEALTDPLRTRKPTRWFVNSMSDLFHEGVSDAYIDKVFAVMALTPWHTYQILTKRPERMLEYFSKAAPAPVGTLKPEFWRRWHIWAAMGDFGPNSYQFRWDHENCGLAGQWPFKNVWLGVSVEDQQRANERIPLLLETPAAVRFLSVEPMLGPVDITNKGIRNGYSVPTRMDSVSGRGIEWTDPGDKFVGVHWVIVGGESGPGARPFDIQWARDVIAQCKAAGVPVFFKQMGSRPVETYGELAVERSPLIKDRKGGDVTEWPEDLRVREMPEVSA